MTSSYSGSGMLDGKDREWLLKMTRRLLAEAQAISSRTAAVNEITTAINRSLDLDEILEIVGKQAKWLLDFEHCSVCLVDVGRCITLFGPTLANTLAEVSEHSLIQRALHTKYPQILTGTEGTVLGKDLYSSGDIPLFPSQIILPLEVEDRLLGVIAFATTKPQAYNQEDLRIGHLLALQLSAAIRNAQQFQEIRHLNEELEAEKRRSEQLLLSILPHDVATELKHHGKVEPVFHNAVSVIFTDFCEFTKMAEMLTPAELIAELDDCFSRFDEIIRQYGLEKLKTIGDSYMCVGGLSPPSENHAADAVAAALDIQEFIRERRQQRLADGLSAADIRIGIHSGSIIAGVIGRDKFAYDIWGDTVNVASRMETSAIAGSINISKATYILVKDQFLCHSRGEILVKNKGYLEMYWVDPRQPCYNRLPLKETLLPVTPSQEHSSQAHLPSLPPSLTNPTA